MKEYHILNLGAGVQSSMLYLLAAQKHKVMPPIDYAIFADVGDEPRAVYAHLEWLKSLGGPEILVRNCGSRLSDDLVSGRSPSGSRMLNPREGLPARRFATIPAFTMNGGLGKRQCTVEYKVDVIERTIRREIVGLKPRQKFPVKDIAVHQYMGLSFDEARRVLRVNARFHSIPWSTAHFPLFETNTTRAGAKTWLKPRVPHEVPRSGCVYCPYHDQEEWRCIKSVPEDWALAVKVDKCLRDKDSVCTRGRTDEAFVHRSCVPLEDADLSSPDPHAEFGFVRECEGMCGV